MNGDRLPTCWEVRDVLRYRLTDIVKVSLSEKQDARTGELLCKGGYPKFRARGVERALLFVGVSIALFKRDLAVDPDEDGTSESPFLCLVVK